MSRHRLWQQRYVLSTASLIHTGSFWTKRRTTALRQDRHVRFKQLASRITRQRPFSGLIRGVGGGIHHLSSVLFQTEWERAPLTISRAKLLFTSGEPCPLRRPSRRVVQSSGVRVLSWGQIKSWRADMAATPGSSPLCVSTREKRWFCWFSLCKRLKKRQKSSSSLPPFAPQRNIFSSVL